MCGVVCVSGRVCVAASSLSCAISCASLVGQIAVYAESELTYTPSFERASFDLRVDQDGLAFLEDFPLRTVVHKRATRKILLKEENDSLPLLVMAGGSEARLDVFCSVDMLWLVRSLMGGVPVTIEGEHAVHIPECYEDDDAFEPRYDWR